MKFERLKDGTTAFLREMTAGDQDRSLHFFRSLPRDERRYLRVDVTRADIIDRRIRQAVAGEVYRIIALIEDEIIADGSLETAHDQWRGHMGEIRVIVSPQYRCQGLARIFIRELFKVAQQKRMEKVVVKMLGPQTSVRTICEKLGFHLEAEVPDYVKDQEGELQSLIIMGCTMDAWFHSMREFQKESSWADG